MMTKKFNKVKNSEIKMNRLQLVNLEKEVANIIEDTANKVFRMRYTNEDGKKENVRMKWNGKRSKEETLKAMQLKRLNITKA